MIRLANGDSHPASVLYVSPLGISVLRARLIASPALRVGSSRGLGEGSPLELSSLSGPEDEGLHADRITLAARPTGVPGQLSISSGSPESSALGSPAVNASGEVVGILTATGVVVGMDTFAPELREMRAPVNVSLENSQLLRESRPAVALAPAPAATAGGTEWLGTALGVLLITAAFAAGYYAFRTFRREEPTPGSRPGREEVDIEFGRQGGRG
jgi:hypothetical protein